MIHPSQLHLIKGLIAQNLGDETTLLKLAEDEKRKSKPYLLYVVEKGAVNAHALMEYLSQRYIIPMLDLDAAQIDEMAVQKIDKSLMLKHWVLPITRDKSYIYLAVIDPTDFKATEEVKFNTGLEVVPIVVEADKLAKAIMGLSDSTQIQLDDIVEPNTEGDNEDDNELDIYKSQDDEDDSSPATRFVKQLLITAIQRGVSDIHLEPYERDIRVRFRQDGVLHDEKHIPISMKEAVVSKLKILCKLDISERRLPQDGRLRVRVSASKTIDFRVSFLPTNFGETTVMRLLDPSNSKVPIEALGFLPEQRKLFEEAIRRPYGMILVTGPTGSGKTTTLYTALNMLNTTEVNISTAEDPVEIPVYGINQVSINERVGLNFATVLRSFLRQDPDIIMVGEVRDLETAETAIKAAQTGHLVLATLHTNDAPQTLTRLENMGIPTYNIAGAVHLVMAQRLARKLCTHCKEPLKVPEQALMEAGFTAEELQGWRPMGPKGCPECNDSGYKGRIGLYQVMPISDDMKDIILRGGTSMDLARQAQKEGIMTMRQAGLKQVKEGVTSLEEILRVTNL